MLIRLLGLLARRGLLPVGTAGAAVARALSLRHGATIEIVRPLGKASQVRLRLDLAYSGCLELLVAPCPGAPDVGTAALLIGLATDAELMVDVGANVGLFSYLVAAAVPNVRVLSLEPTPALAAIVADNVARNGWHPRVFVRAEAIGAAPGTSALYILQGADTENTLDPGRIAGRDYHTIQVPVVTIDDLLADNGALADRTVLKIDVEGHERAALDGMERTLRKPGRRPDVIMEFLGHAIEHDRIIERALGYGVDVYYIGPTGLTQLHTSDDLSPVHTLGYWNFLLTSRPPADVLALGRRVGIPAAKG